jgi:hypothetical protein
MKLSLTRSLAVLFMSITLLISACGNVNLTQKVDEELESAKANIEGKKVELIKKGNDEIDSALDKVETRIKDEVNTAIENQFDDINNKVSIPEGQNE